MKSAPKFIGIYILYDQNKGEEMFINKKITERINVQQSRSVAILWMLSSYISYLHALLPKDFILDQRLKKRANCWNTEQCHKYDESR